MENNDIEYTCNAEDAYFDVEFYTPDPETSGDYKIRMTKDLETGEVFESFGFSATVYDYYDDVSEEDVPDSVKGLFKEHRPEMEKLIEQNCE